MNPVYGPSYTLVLADPYGHTHTHTHTTSGPIYTQSIGTQQEQQVSTHTHMISPTPWSAQKTETFSDCSTCGASVSLGARTRHADWHAYIEDLARSDRGQMLLPL